MLYWLRRFLQRMRIQTSTRFASNSNPQIPDLKPSKLQTESLQNILMRQ